MGRHGGKGDVFAFGVTAWQLAHATASGLPYPFSRGDPSFSDDDQWIHALVEDAVPANTLLSPPLLRLIAACLDKDPGVRPSMEQVLGLIAEWRALLTAEPALGCHVRTQHGGAAAMEAAGEAAARRLPHQQHAWSGSGFPAHPGQQKQRVGGGVSGSGLPPNQRYYQPQQHALAAGGSAASPEGASPTAVYVTREQLAHGKWSYIGPSGEQSDPVSSVALVAALKAGRVGGVAPVVVWPAGVDHPVGVPLASMLPLLKCAQDKRRWPAAPMGRGCLAAVAGPAGRLRGRRAAAGAYLLTDDVGDNQLLTAATTRGAVEASVNTHQPRSGACLKLLTSTISRAQQGSKPRSSHRPGRPTQPLRPGGCCIGSCWGGAGACLSGGGVEPPAVVAEVKLQAGGSSSVCGREASWGIGKGAAECRGAAGSGVGSSDRSSRSRVRSASAG